MSTPAKLNRRQHLEALFAAGVLTSALLSIPGCGQPTRALDGSRPEAPDAPVLEARSFEESCNSEGAGGVNWVPDIVHPVFWGYQDLDMADGAPGPLRVYYPTYDGSPQGAQFLQLCFARYPVVLFLHGQPPNCPGEDYSEYYKRWEMVGMVLARSGYVVVAPKHSPKAPDGDQSGEIALSLSALDWVRDTWENREWVDPKPEATAVVGHSWGALLASRVRQARPTISAYAGLSGPWHDYADPQLPLALVNPPSFFMWTPDWREELDNKGVWDLVPMGKTRATFPGEHFDYLSMAISECSPHGACSAIELVSAELVALFISRNVPAKNSDAPIGLDLIPPTVTLTPEQAFFAGAHLEGIQGIQTQQGCGIDLGWEDFFQGSGSRHLGP